MNVLLGKQRSKGTITVFARICVSKLYCGIVEMSKYKQFLFLRQDDEFSDCALVCIFKSIYIF